MVHTVKYNEEQGDKQDNDKKHEDRIGMKKGSNISLRGG